jgi:hypothetical protein
VNTPFKIENVLELNDSYDVQFYENEKILIVDNWYKNFDLLQEIVLQLPVTCWKTSQNGKNFVEYYDCKSSIGVHSEVDKKITSHYTNTILNLIEQFFKEKNLQIENGLLEFNFFKNIKKNVDSKLQHFPHKDSKYNCIIYFDNVSSGGTAIYPEIEKLENKEHMNIMFDVSEYQINLIQSRPNRLVIFEGNKFHGGYIENHNQYVDNWRINQVLFIDKKNDLLF